jgi:SAM-dependent methyltransferase
MDTLRIGKEAAHVTGVDFSPKAIKYARALSERMGIAATFIEADVYELEAKLTGDFDIVFTSYRVLGWLPDLGRWAQIVAGFLRHGGHFFIAEAHPLIWIFDDNAPELAVRYTYFAQPEPLILPAPSYADPTATVTNSQHVFAHGLEEILMSLREAGLHIDEFREHAHVVWKAFPFLIEERPGRWVMPPDRPHIPLLFSLRASKP